MFSPRMQRLLDLLPCAGNCGRPGPHPIHAARAGGLIAVCRECEAEVRQSAGERTADVLHEPTLRPGYLAA